MTLPIYEAESYIKSLQLFPLNEIGNIKYMVQYEYLNKLNIQAHHSALLSKHDEYIVEGIITFEKINILIYELINIEVWKKNVMKYLLDPKFISINEISTVKLYFLIYHEAVICNLLEIVFYNQTIINNISSDALVELIDYCHRKFLSINTNEIIPKDVIASNNESNIDSIIRQSKEIETNIIASSTSIFRFITDSISTLPLSCFTRIVSTHDMLVITISLLESQWWNRKVKGGLEKYVDSKWCLVESTARLQISKTEAQLWLIIYNLSMDITVRNKYQFNTYRINQISRLRKYFNTVIIDQLPMLVDLQRLVEELAISNAPAVENTLLLCEVLPEWYESLQNTNWEKLARESIEYLKNSDSNKEEMSRMAQLYNTDAFEEIMEAPRCSKCNGEASQRCSKCKKVWYCSRECQVSAWAEHKTNCQQ